VACGQRAALRWFAVGQRSGTDTIVAILKAFLEQRTWKQADLARAIEISPAALHKRLKELQQHGIPLSAEAEHPHVYWSVPKSWFPGGVLFTGDQITEILRLLSRIGKSKARDAFIDRLIQFLPGRDATREIAASIVPAETTAREEQHLPKIEDSARTHVALRFRYFSQTKGNETMRFASVHRVLIGPPARFVATCHRSDTLKWFRVENISEAQLDANEPFRPADAKRVDAHVRASLDGFHEGGAPTTHVFFVQNPEARWVARNLMEEMHAEEVPNGIRVTVETSALQRLARYVVGLGGSAKPLTPELTNEVERLARGAIEATGSV